MRQGWGGVESPFQLSQAALQRHLYVVGKTGTGKTTLLKNLFLELVQSGHGVALIDPHGDLASSLLDLLPRRDAARVTYFNPSDQAHPIAWNIVADVPVDERPTVAAGIVSALKNVWGDSWGPRLEYILYNGIRALLDADHTTLLGLSKMLTNDTYRAWVVRQIEDPFVQAFWTEEFEGYDQRFRQEAIAPIQNKIGALVTNPVLRNMLGQVKRKLDLPFLMNNGGIFIANLAKGAIGEAPANLIGSLLVSEFQRAAMSRASSPESMRRNFCLIIDEFQNFTTGAFASILSEARKFRLSLVLSHQFTSQLQPNIRDAVFGNAGTIIAFQTGFSDAELLAKEYADSFAPSHFVDRERFHILVKPCAIDGAEQPFRGRTHPCAASRTRSKDMIVRTSRQRYTTVRATVEEKLRRWVERWEQE
jgi:hypothetical protein